MLTQLASSEPYRELMGYILGDVLGSGASGVVRIGVQKDNNNNNNNDQHKSSVVAIKMVSKTGEKEELDKLLRFKKEILIHYSLGKHQNIIQAFMASEDDQGMYLAMEYAMAGELFDRIAPDVGLDHSLVHLYFRQLVAGMQYIHSKGISHRDLKPENMLLDAEANLKISDFGLGTKFINKDGSQRVLNTPCGTPPYIAPEIHNLSYLGTDVDIWSAGIILYVMLVGNTPWAERKRAIMRSNDPPTAHDQEYLFYSTNYANNPMKLVSISPWSNFSPPLAQLLFGILNPNPSHRFTAHEICHSEWFCTANSFLSPDGKCSNPVLVAELIMKNLGGGSQAVAHGSSQDDDEVISYSQPQQMRVDHTSNMADLFASQGSQYQQPPDMMSFSQPATRHNNHLLNDSEESSSLSSFSNSTPATRARSLFCQMLPSEALTRYYSDASPEQVLVELSNQFDAMVVPSKIHKRQLKIQFQTVDRRKCPLHGDVFVQRCDGNSLVVFRRTKGDPIEFKRFFKVILGSVNYLE